MQLAPQPPSVLSRVVRRGEVQAAVIRRAGEMFRPRAIGTAAFLGLKLDVGFTIRRGDIALAREAGSQMRMAAGIGRRGRCAAPAPAICTRTAGSRGFRRA